MECGHFEANMIAYLESCADGMRTLGGSKPEQPITARTVPEGDERTYV